MILMVYRAICCSQCASSGPFRHPQDQILQPCRCASGVSACQSHFSPQDTPGDNPDVWEAMNPAALKTGLPWLLRNAVLIIDADVFSTRNPGAVGYQDNRLDDPALRNDWSLHLLRITTLALNALEELNINRTVLHSGCSPLLQSATRCFQNSRLMF